MPKGIVVMEWNERSGAEAIAQFPDNLEVNQKTLMQIYAAHDYEEASGLVTLMVGPLNLISYYTGEESGYYIVLVLDLDEEGEVFEDALVDAGRIILESIEHDTLKIILSGVFGRIANYPKMERSQLLALLYQSKVKRLIMDRLKREGYIAKSELNIWLKELFDFQFVDLDSELMALVKHGIITQGTVKGFPSEILYLMNVLFITRAPQKDIFIDPEARGLPVGLVKQYKDGVVEFFKHYAPEDEDNLIVTEMVAGIATYEVIKLLRMSVVTKETLEKLKKKGVDDVDATIKKLLDANIIMKLDDESSGQRYYGLKTDLRVQRLFPEYLINVARQSHNEHSKSSKVLIEHMKLIKEAYLESLKTGK